MRKVLLAHLSCPECEEGDDLTLQITTEEGEWVVEGTLSCDSCQRQYPIRDGIVNFLENLEGHTEKVSEIFSKDFVQKYKSRWDKSAAKLTELKIKQLLAQASSGAKGSLFVDVGAGFCKYSQVLLNAGVQPVAVDLSEDMLRASTEILSPEEAHQIDRIVADSSKLPFKTDSFDGFVCINVFQYLERPRESLQESRRVCSAGADFIIHMINLQDLRLKYMVFKALISLKGLLAHKQMMDGYQNIMSLGAMRKYFSEEGLDTSEQWPVNIFLPLEDTLFNKISSRNPVGSVYISFKKAIDSILVNAPIFRSMYNAYICKGKYKSTNR
ncbi:MAG: methyltransferase domain-containing protein [Planctomycetes bacterium]|nr:methyltransferase domain-containing protein [Planctomycetota bacterium]